MKLSFLTIFMILLLSNSFSQTHIMLTFTCRDSATQSPVSPDSVQVRNLTKNSDTVIFGPVPVLDMIAYWPYGIDESIADPDGGFILKQNYPNPFQETTQVDIYKESKGSLTLTLFGEAGAKLAQFQGRFEKGVHSFVISSPGKTVLILSATDGKNCRSVKIIGSGQGNGGSSITYLREGRKKDGGVLKDQGIAGFRYYMGNELLYTTYATGYREQSKTDHPSNDSTYLFNMAAAGLPVVTTSALTNINSTSATSGGNVTSDGGTAITEKGVCWSTAPHPTIAGIHTHQGGGSGMFESTLTGLVPFTLYYVAAYATNSAGIAYGNQLSLMACGDFITVNHIAGAVAPVAKTATYGTSANVPGELTKCWITSNLGADHQAGAVDDATEASAGWYWQFNRKQGYKHDGTTRTPDNVWITEISESSDWTMGNDPCHSELGDGWRIPTSTEWINVDAASYWADWYGPWNSALKMHAAGCLFFLSNGALFDKGSVGYYWSSIRRDGIQAHQLLLMTGTCAVNSEVKAMGNTVRCIKSESGDLCTVTTTEATAIGCNTATLGGNVISGGGSSVTGRGVCWSTSQGATIQSDKFTSNGSGTGAYVSILDSLQSNTQYYVRAYALNITGTSYGNEVSFQTPAAILPSVSTAAITNNEQTIAISGGIITSDGGSLVTERGVCWSLSPNPTISDSKTMDGNGTGSFISHLTGLTPGTQYYVKAYATNTLGTAYGNEITFLASIFSVGQIYQGGIIFYVDGEHGLIASGNDLSVAGWGCYGTTIGGTSSALGTGAANTSSILNGCSTADIAARLCDELVLNGYDDWYLPSIDELSKMYIHKDIIGGFSGFFYWSSTEYDANYAYMAIFVFGAPGTNLKSSSCSVRAVRSF